MIGTTEEKQSIGNGRVYYKPSLHPPTILCFLLPFFMLWVVPSSQAQDIIPQVDIRLEAQPASVLDAPQTRQEFAGFLPIKGGYVLTHEHPQVAMSFGGNYAFAGRPGNYDPTVGIMDKGYAGSCGGCVIGGFCDHGEIKGTFAGHATGADMGDHGSFDAPKHNSFSHMRYATDWIKDAFNPKEDRYSDTRLKVMVAFAMDNEAMCESLYHVGKKNPTGAGGAGYECKLGDSIQSLKRQIAAIKQWAKRERDWMRIAYTAQDIREIEKENKLAIIIGVEADYAWGAENKTFDPVNRLHNYYDLGVRTFYLAHKINSRLTGADIYGSSETVAGKAIRGAQGIAGCLYYDDAVGNYSLRDSDGFDNCANEDRCGPGNIKGPKVTDFCNSRMSEISEINTVKYMNVLGYNYNGFANYPLPPGFSGSAGSRIVNTTNSGAIERNNLGLSVDGERVVRAAMKLGMIMNLDHISSVSRNIIYNIAINEFNNYPLNAMHNNPNERLIGIKANMLTGTHGALHPHEYDFEIYERDMIRNSGGIFGVRLGPVKSKPYAKSGVTNSCPRTATETAKIMAFLLDEGQRIGYSVDYATVTEGLHSRTFEGCGLIPGEADQFNLYKGRVTEGLSHIGVMKKFHHELKTVGLKESYLETLRHNGVEDFVRMWEMSERKALSCSTNSDCEADQVCGGISMLEPTNASAENIPATTNAESYCNTPPSTTVLNVESRAANVRNTQKKKTDKKPGNNNNKSMRSSTSGSAIDSTRTALLKDLRKCIDTGSKPRQCMSQSKDRVMQYCQQIGVTKQRACFRNISQSL